MTGLGGAAALSNSAAASAQPVVSASNYDAKLGPAWNAGVGYHIDDWFSVQAGYIWNRNRIIASQVIGAAFLQKEDVRTQHAIAADVMLYFRPRTSRIRPYLSAGPAWVRMLSQNKPGLRVAVGVDLMSRRTGWGFRYSFSEMTSANPFGKALQPPGQRRLMNFQNIFGVIKTF